MALRRGFRPRGRGLGRPRRRMEWARTFITSTAATVAGGALATNLLTDFETALGASLLGSTVLRIRGEIVSSPDTQADSLATFGFIVTNEDIAAAAIEPVGDRYADWMGYGSHRYIAAPAAASLTLPLRTHVDVKSKRKLMALEDTLWFVFQPTVADQHYTAFFSVLLALH